jgi:hypothetical protein
MRENLAENVTGQDAHKRTLLLVYRAGKPWDSFRKTTVAIASGAGEDCCPAR